MMSFQEQLAIFLGRLLDNRLNSWRREAQEAQERGDDLITVVLQQCIREVEGDLEAARIAATPRPPARTRTISEMVEQLAANQSAEQGVGG